MDYAIIKTGGKQYRVSSGDVIEVEKLTGSAGDSIIFSEVLMLRSATEVKFGTPMISGLSVSGKVVEQFKNDKIRVSKYKAKVRHRRTTGHRQQLTRVQIEAIGGAKSKLAEKQPLETKTAPDGEKKEIVKKPASKKTA